MDIQTRLINYYKNNQFIQKYMKGIDSKTNEIVLFFNNENKRITMGELEKIISEEELINFMNGVSNETVVIPEINAKEVEVVPEEQAMLTETEDLTRETLNDIKILTELKNKDALNNLIKDFSINPSTGLIDINKSISTVTNNTMKEVVKSIRNNYEFIEDLTKYDVDGTFIGTPTTGFSSEDEKITKSFNNIRIFIEASKMYPEQVNYNDSQVNELYKTYFNKVKEELHGGAVPNVEKVPPKNEETIVSPSAGFADIFVLTVIVLVYAVIIVNLIFKLK